MFLRNLLIALGNGEVIREIKFHRGLNLIVDDTPASKGKETGNNVGKTTVLKLIDYCLGGSDKGIYVDIENPKNEYKLVKDFLIDKEVIIKLAVEQTVSGDSTRHTIIERNFLKRTKKIQRINGVNRSDDEFIEGLTELLVPGHYGKKPTFRQIIAHNVRYEEQSLSNTLKHLNRFTRDDEYEALYLFLLGCKFDDGEKKQELRKKIELEERFRSRLQAKQTKSAYQAALAIVDSEIEKLNEQKQLLKSDPDFERSLDRLNRLKVEINGTTSNISRLELRKGIIHEAKSELENDVSTVDVESLRDLYKDASELLVDVQRSFEELLHFHNQMIHSKVNFITKELPLIESQLESLYETVRSLKRKEEKLSSQISTQKSFEDVEKVILDLNEKHRQKGEYENVLNQLNDVDAELEKLKNNLTEIDSEIFSEDYLKIIQDQVNNFNKYFSLVSKQLYGETYALKVDMKTVKGKRVYEFSTFNTNFSSGKKQGEISCFDIAYTLFADSEGIPCLHFLLNDKRELMHGNQLINIARLVNSNDIQFVASILRDKLPEELNKEENICLQLSQDDKLFRIAK